MTNPSRKSSAARCVLLRFAAYQLGGADPDVHGRFRLGDDASYRAIASFRRPCITSVC